MKNLSLPYECRIGVTGHRNLPDPAGVERAVQAVLDHLRGVFERAAEFPLGKAGSHFGLRKRFDRLLLRVAGVFWRGLPATPQSVPAQQRTPLHWTVVSPLAKGADRIVARAVLNQAQDEGKPKLQVVSPFALDDYRCDFEDPADLNEFEELLKYDSVPTILPGNYGKPEEGDSPEVTAAKQSQRNEGYYAAGKRVVDACEILIAVWNGEEAAGHGGTGDIVQYAADKGRAVVWIDSTNSEKPARIITGPAPEKIRKNEGVVQGLLHRPLPKRAQELSSVFHRLAAYNRSPAFDQDKYQATLDRNRNELLTAADDADMHRASIEPVLDALLPTHARADQLAMRYQQLYVHAAVWLQRLSSIAVSVVVVQVLFFPHQLWLILFEILAMLLAVALLRISRREAWHEKWLRDRHLAERLRIALFTTLASSGRESQLRPDETLSFYQSSDDWIVETCDRLASDARDQHASTIAFAPLKRFLISAWLRDQAEYHKGNAKRKERSAHTAHRLGLVFFCVTMLMAVLHLFGVGHASDDEHHGAGLISQFITALAITLPAWGATVHSVNTLLERERISTRSAQMATVLNQLVQQAEQANTPEELAIVVSQAEELMLMENHEWWVSLSFRPPILPA